MFVLRKKTLFAAFAALLALIIVIVGLVAVLGSGSTIDFETTFYYVCYNSPSDVHSASSVSTLVKSYGGAGYVVKNGNDYYVTVSCYYKESDALSVCKTLKNKGMECFVQETKVKKKSLKGSAKSQKKKYLGNLNTLLSLSVVCYDLANSLDNFTCNQSGAKAILSEVKNGLDALCRQNAANCFSSELSALQKEREDASEGYVFSCDVRRLQIAMCDCIVNVKLY